MYYAAQHVALAAEAGLAANAETCCFECSPDMASRGVGGKGSARGSSFGNLVQEIALPEFRVSGRSKSVQKPSVGCTHPLLKRPPRISYNQGNIQLGHRELNPAKLDLPDQLVRKHGEFGKTRQRTKRVCSRHRMGLERRIVQAPGSSRARPCVGSDKHAESGSEAKLSYMESRAKPFRQAVAGKKDVPCFADGVVV